MKPTTDLFDLIKSLTPNEKRYFKLYATSIGGKENSAYMRLFNAIDGMTRYNEELLKEKFKKEAFVKQLSVAKNYLFYVILKSLALSSIESNKQTELYLSVMQIEILYDKGLLDTCSKQITLVKKELLKYEEKLLLCKVLDVESRIMIKRFQFPELSETLEEEKRLLQERLLALTYKTLAVELFGFIQSMGSMSDPATLHRLQEMIARLDHYPLPPDADTTTRYYYYSCYNFYYGAIRDAEKRLEFAEKVFAILQSNPHYLEANARIYFSASSNLCQALLGINDFHRVTQKLTEMKNSPFISHQGIKKEIRVEALASILNTEILLHINQRNTSKVNELLSEVKHVLQAEKPLVGNFYLLELNFNTAHLLFLAKRFDEALDFLRNTLYHSGKNERRDLYLAGRIFELILLHETGNHKLLVNLADTTSKYLKRIGYLKHFDGLLIQYLRTSVKKVQPDLLQELQKQLHIALKEKEYSILTQYLDLEFWLQEQQKKISP
jgi:hypothetical protein